MNLEDLSREQLIKLVETLSKKLKQAQSQQVETQGQLEYKPTLGELKMAWRAKNGIK